MKEMLSSYINNEFIEREILEKVEGRDFKFLGKDPSGMHFMGEKGPYDVLSYQDIVLISDQSLAKNPYLYRDVVYYKRKRGIVRKEEAIVSFIDGCDVSFISQQFETLDENIGMVEVERVTEFYEYPEDKIGEVRAMADDKIDAFGLHYLLKHKQVPVLYEERVSHFRANHDNPLVNYVYESANKSLSEMPANDVYFDSFITKQKYRK